MTAQGGSRTQASTPVWRSPHPGPHGSRPTPHLPFPSLPVPPAPRPCSVGAPGVIKPQAGPLGFLGGWAGLPASSSLPGASAAALAGVVGAVMKPVGQHLSVTCRIGWRRACKESGAGEGGGEGLGVAGAGVGVGVRCQASSGLEQDRVWV